MAEPIILVVDDDAPIRAALERLLRRAGYRVETAASVAAARRALAELPDLGWLLCDLSLPDGTTVGLLEALRVERPELVAHTIVLTGGPTDRCGTLLLDAGGFRVLEKPFDIRVLLAMLADADVN